MHPTDDFNAQIEERFAELPKVVQDAIVSADIEKHLRELAEHHKLHLDQWETLENEVMLALLGFRPAGDLAHNIETNVHVDPIVSAALASDISTIVFQPIREELERELSHPDAVAKSTTAVEDMRTSVLSAEHATNQPVAPAGTEVAAPLTATAPIPAVPSAAGAPSAPIEPAMPLPHEIPTTPVSSAAIAPTATTTAPVVPATPPQSPPDQKIERAAVPDSYATTASHERKTIAGDPYREQIQ